MSTDIRWKQRFDNYSKAFLELQEAVDLARARPFQTGKAGHHSGL